MQTKLRISGLMFAASLLGAPPTPAATHPQQTEKASGVVRKPMARPVGMASWYGKDRQGRKMANGQKFDYRALTAANWALPLGTVIRVVNLKNGKSVVVTVTDRGPAQRLNRILDLSEAAAEQLGYVEKGLTPVFYSTAAYFETESSAISGGLVAPPSGEPVLTAKGEALPAL